MATAAGITKVDDHGAEGVDLLLEQFRDSTKFQAWIQTYLNRLQEVEDVTWQLLVDRRIDAAAGVNLDLLGRIVGQPRGELADTAYRLAIKGRVRANVSDGTALDIHKTLVAMLGESVSARLEEHFPMTVSMVILTAVTEPEVVADILKASRAATVRLDMEYSSYDEANTFTFSSDDTIGSDSGRGFANDSATTGGHLAGVI